MGTPIVVINGPTASGKTQLALDLAQRFLQTSRPTEIVNADAMLVYRGMDIGTAKPTPAERHKVRHHLIDFLDVTDTATVADFQRRAREQILECQQRAAMPLVTGGSALYVRGIIDRFEFSPSDSVIRARLEAECAATGLASLRQRLAQVAPEAAEAIEGDNARRIIRALEIFELTGQVRPRLPAPDYALPHVLQIGLTLPREVMDARIEQRVVQMFHDGFVAEVETLVERGLREAKTAKLAIGYQQVLSYLDGEVTVEEAIELIVRKTRRFARKQLSWFRRDPRIVWFSALSEHLPADVESAIVDFTEKSLGVCGNS